MSSFISACVSFHSLTHTFLISHSITHPSFSGHLLNIYCVQDPEHLVGGRQDIPSLLLACLFKFKKEKLKQISPIEENRQSEKNKGL